MILVLDDVVDLNSTFQSDSMKILDELDQPNINEKWYSLEEQHPFDNFCNSEIFRFLNNIKLKFYLDLLEQLMQIFH